MARTNNLTNFLTDVADSIREKTGKSDPIPCEDFDTEIESISGGGLPEKGIVATKWNNEGYPTEYYVKGITSLGSGFFAYSQYNYEINKYLEKVIIDENITEISFNMSCFSGCQSLQQIIGIEKHRASYFSSSCFNNCQNLELAELPSNLSGNQNQNNVFNNCKKITIKKIPDGVTTITGSNHFSGCTSITEMDLNNCTMLGYQTFSGCTGLTKVIGNNVTGFSGQGTFQGCTNLTDVSLPNVNYNNIQVASNCFYNCTSLKTIEMKRLPKLPNGFFGNCTSLVSAGSFPNVTYIYGNNATNGAFYNCSSLKAIWIGNLITSANFQRYVFRGCTSLTKIYINLPRATVESFANYQYAFSSISTTTQTLQPSVIICNDDNDFITQEQFDAIDWENYTEE